MLSYKNWKMINESVLGASSSLGLGQPRAVGGLVGAHFQTETGFGQELDSDEDDEEDEDDLGDDDEEIDLFGDTPEGTDMPFPPDSPADDLGGDELGGPAAGAGEEGGFLDDLDIDPNMLGDETLGAPGEEGAADVGGEPCPECNPDGSGEGQPDCPGCGGLGFLDDGADELDVDVDGGGEAGSEDPNGEMMDLMKRMNDYCCKYMNKSFMTNTADVAGVPQPLGGKKLNKVEAATQDENELVQSLRSCIQQPRKHWCGISEEQLLKSLDPNAEFVKQPVPGSVGYAPQQRLNAFDADYSDEDLGLDLPTLDF